MIYKIYYKLVIVKVLKNFTSLTKNKQIKKQTNTKDPNNVIHLNKKTACECVSETKEAESGFHFLQLLFV